MKKTKFEKTKFFSWFFQKKNLNLLEKKTKSIFGFFFQKKKSNEGEKNQEKNLVFSSLVFFTWTDLIKFEYNLTWLYKIT